MTPAPRRRTGFTLVELLVVITILGILIALLVPAVFSAVNRANDARVAGEINTLGQALASFKNKYQEYPPSRIVLVEDGGYDINTSPTFYSGMSYAPAPSNIGGMPQVIAGTGVTDIGYPALAQRSITYLRKLFPKAQFTTGPVATGIPGGNYDFNGNGVNDDADAPSPIYLEGHECLVFFLGGIPVHTQVGSTYQLEGVNGFGANPRNPFRAQYLPNGTADPVGQNRVEPFFEFRAERLVDDDLDGIPGYIDPLGQGPAARYFAYFSSYGGSGYDPNDVNFSVASDSVTPRPSQLNEVGNLATSFTVSFPVTDGTNSGRQTASRLPNPYTSSLPVATGNKPATFHQAQSYQIISAGRDRLYGPGGQYSESDSGDRLSASGGADPDRERDNVTNFSNGTLD